MLLAAGQSSGCRHHPMPQRSRADRRRRPRGAGAGRRRRHRRRQRLDRRHRAAGRGSGRDASSASRSAATAAPARPASQRCPPETEIVCFLDGDGSDVPQFLAAVVGPIAAGEADFVMGSRLRGRREPGSMTPQQIVAGWLAGVLLRLTYGVTLHRHVAVPRDAPRSPARARHERADLWLESRNADARRGRRLAHPRSSGRSSLPPRRRLEGVGQSRRRPQARRGRSRPRFCGLRCRCGRCRAAVADQGTSR